MTFNYYFLRHDDFISKKGTDCHMLTVCDSQGNVGTLFHDESVLVPRCALFAPLEVEMEISALGKNFKKTVLSIKEV